MRKWHTDQILIYSVFPGTENFTLFLCSIWAPVSLGSRPSTVFNYPAVEVLIRYFKYLSCDIEASTLSCCEQPRSRHSLCLCTGKEGRNMEIHPNYVSLKLSIWLSRRISLSWCLSDLLHLYKKRETRKVLELPEIDLFIQFLLPGADKQDSWFQSSALQ